MNKSNDDLVGQNTTQQSTNNSSRMKKIVSYYDQTASSRDRWIAQNQFFHDQDARFMQFLIPPGLKILDLGCGTGKLLESLEPKEGIGLDISSAMVKIAQKNYPKPHFPNLEFQVADIENPQSLESLKGPFDIIVLSDTIGLLQDVEATLASLHKLCSRSTRIVVAYYSWLWVPVLSLAELFGVKMRQMPLNRLGSEDISGLLELADFDVIKRDWRQLLPKRVFGIGILINRTLATFPFFRRFCIRHYLVARSLQHKGIKKPSATIVIPCRNERGNIEPAISRIPAFCHDIEIIFVEGHSKDGTPMEIQRVISKYPDKDIKFLTQDGKGKGNAVHLAFKAARGDIIMILDIILN